MKRTLFLLLNVCFFSKMIFAQVQTQPEDVAYATSSCFYTYQVFGVVFKYDREYSLSIGIIYTRYSSPVFIPKGKIILLKCKNDSIIELKSNDDSRINRTFSGLPYQDGVIVVNYDISEEELKALAKEGIKKVRIETSDSFLDLKGLRKKSAKLFKEGLALSGIDNKVGIRSGF